MEHTAKGKKLAALALAKQKDVSSGKAVIVRGLCNQGQGQAALLRL
jgi:hypothetical protein